jgi:hypothetical protein
MLNKKGKFYDFLKKIKISLYLLINILFGFLLSAFKLLEYKVDSLDYTLFYDRSFPTEIYSFFYCSENFVFICTIFYILQMVNNIFNDIIFFLFTIGVDAALILNLRKVIKKKKEIINNFKEKEEAKKLKHLKKMLIINGIMFILSHLPEMLIRSLLFFSNDRLIDFCLVDFRCDKLNEFGDFFNYFTIISQLFINLKFNKLCNESYQNLKIKLKPSKMFSGSNNRTMALELFEKI